MVKLKKVFMVGAVVATISALSLNVFAATQYKTRAEAVAALTGKTVESVTKEKEETGKTYSEIANESGKLEEYKNIKLEMKKDRLSEKVKNGEITQEKADEIIKKMEERQANCDGTELGKNKNGEGKRKKHNMNKTDADCNIVEDSNKNSTN